MQNDSVRELVDRVRTRWRAQRLFEATVRGALAAAAAIGVALVAARWSTGAPGLLAFVIAAALLLAAAALGRAFWPLRRSPGDIQVARFIEERAPALEDRLVSAVDVANPAPTTSAASPFADLMMADAGRRAQDVDLDAVLPSIALRRAGFQAAASLLVLAAVLWTARGPARQAFDSASLSLFPARVVLEVTPGNARIKAGSALAIQARLVGNRAPIIAQVQIADGDRWRGSEMSTDAPGSFRFGVDAVTAPFKYRVAAGPLRSPVYEVAVAHAPRVKRIDVEYTYPAGLRLPPRTESDGGDIYAPPGTDVRVRVFTDRPAATGEMTLGDGKRLALTSDAPTELSTSLKVVDDNSYRVALVDREGMGNSGETEYFIRTLDDRPPDVRILKPASDRSVTRLEEVDVEAQAEDDYGVDRLDLVYSVHGAEKVVPLPIARGALVNGRHTLYLEDLDVQPGDVVSYYVRARDLTRGTRPNEARSDMFFLEVKPYEQEFMLARSQGGMAGAGANGLDDLIVAQKEVVSATWKLDRRAQAAKGAKSEQDIRSVSRAEADLKTRAEQTSSTFRESTMRDPRRRQPQRGRGGPEPPKAGETLPEEDEVAAAAAAMGQAVGSLDGLKTAEALPHELEALNRLLKAQSAVKRREVQRQQAGIGDGNTSRNYDLSSLFDKELQKAQQTNYETKSSAETKTDPNQSALDKIKDLARRQDELLKRQQELAKNRDAMQEEELKRELEKLSRDQAELRQRAEELARQMNAQQSADSKRQENAKNGKTPSGQQGEQSQSNTPGEQGQSGQRGGSGQGGGDASQKMRDAAEEMRNATSDLRRQDPKQASARGSRALDKLRETARQLEGARPDDRRRALGEMQLEARQMADAERQIASELGKAGSGEAGKDAVRRLAGEQERLAERARRLQETLKRQGSEGSKDSEGSKRSEGLRGSESSQGSRGSAPVQTSQTAADAARELEGQRVAERMQQTAEAMRAAAADARGLRGSTAQPDTTQQARGQVGAQQDLARALDKVADKLAASSGAKDTESRKLSDQLARAQELREGLQRLGQTGQNGRGGQGGTQGSSARKAPGESGEPGQGQQGGGGGTGTDLGKLREEYQRRLQETKELVDQLRRDDPNFARGGGGATLEGAGGVFASPGTEAFKQDFAKWEELRRQATQALEQAEASLSKKLQAKQAKDRLAAGTDDNPPPEYKKQVDSYFKAIAGKKKP
jgi:Domain of unknown function (DUF4175)